jgi:hypothetical protein
MNLRFLISLLCISSVLVPPSYSLAQESLESLPSVLCEVIGHPVYKNTIVFGSGNRELYLIEENRDKNHLHHKDFKLIMNDEGYYAIAKSDGEVLLSITPDQDSFVKILDPKPANYEITNCIPISG